MSHLLKTTKSKIDNKPIDLILTPTSKNSKTGDMPNLWIAEHGKSGAVSIKDKTDSSVCGDCAFRGDKERGIPRLCYVNPMAVNAATRKPKTEPVPEKQRRGKPVRLGAWGDPGAVPVEDLHDIVREYGGRGKKTHTAYSQRWRHEPDSGHAELCMASVHTPAQALLAQKLGWRTFRVTADDVLMPNEIWCPATEEGGSKVDCRTCCLCDGTSNGKRVNVAVKVHGRAGHERAYASVLAGGEDA